MKLLLKILLFLFVCSVLPAQNLVDKKSLKTNFALKENRIKYRKEIEERTEKLFKKPIGYINEKQWLKLFKDISLCYTKNKHVKYAFNYCYENFGKQSIVFNRYLLEASYAIYPGEWLDKIEEIYKTTSDPMLFAYSANILLRENKTYSRTTVHSELKKRFGKIMSNSIIRQMEYDMRVEPDSIAQVLPPLKDLFTNQFQKGKTIIYSLHRKERSFPGITIIRKPDGTFVRNPDSSYFYVPQLACSVSELPAYVRSGNTPQGVYSVIGSYVSPTETIGPTANVLMRIPHEVNPKIFYHKKNQYKGWNIEDYKSLLPESWKEYNPIYNSWYCGKMGRKLIVMHGSTDDLSFYSDRPYYPLTPTKGCLSAAEVWSEEDGTIIRSDQADLMNAFHSTGEMYGFLVVIELDNKQAPVSLDDVLEYLK